VIASILALFASADPAPGAPSAPASMPGAKEIASFGIGEPEAGELAQQAYLKASNTDAYDHFGITIALSGDTLAGGAGDEDSVSMWGDEVQADNGTESSGAVYVFVRNGSKWSQQAFLKASNTGVNDFFGSSVSLSGDTLAVGAYGEASSATGVNGDQADNTAVSSGAAYVFIRKGASWSQEAYLKASNADSGDYFGASVALSGDTLVVGARNEASGAAGVDGNQEDNTAPYSGAAYVFVRNGSVWSQQAYLKASNATKFDGFGDSLALSGDTVAVGADCEASAAMGVNGDQLDNSADKSGAVYVFR